MPERLDYGPLYQVDPQPKTIIMSLEEYECIRLIDFEELIQEECADKMQVARATVQAIYKSARQKIAESLINGTNLRIEGGDYQLYDENERLKACGNCHRSRCQNNLGQGRRNRRGNHK